MTPRQPCKTQTERKKNRKKKARESGHRESKRERERGGEIKNGGSNKKTTAKNRHTNQTKPREIERKVVKLDRYKEVFCKLGK